MDFDTVISAVCARLAAEGFESTARPSRCERGVDVVALHPVSGVQALVAAKGGACAVAGSARYGKAYTQSQVLDHLAKGSFTCLQLRTAHPDHGQVRIIFAVPQRGWFSEYARPLSPLLARAGVELWFAEDEEAAGMEKTAATAQTLPASHG